MKPAYNFPYLLGIAAGETPIRLGFATEAQANRYRYSFYNWRRAARKRGDECYEDVGIYQRAGGSPAPYLVIFATRHNAHLVPELAASFPEPLTLDIPRSEEDAFLMGLHGASSAKPADDHQPEADLGSEKPSPSSSPDGLPEF